MITHESLMRLSHASSNKTRLLPILVNLSPFGLCRHLGSRSIVATEVVRVDLRSGTPDSGAIIPFEDSKGASGFSLSQSGFQDCHSSARCVSSGKGGGSLRVLRQGQRRLWMWLRAVCRE